MDNVKSTIENFVVPKPIWVVDNFKSTFENFACDSLDWTIGRDDWAEYFQPDDEVNLR